MKSQSSSGGLVYSTDSGRMCPQCRQAVAQCQCQLQTKTLTSDGVVRVSRETKGRAGKGVTVVRGLPLGSAELVAMGKRLKTLCGSGGTVKDGTVEVQGDHCERVIDFLKSQAYTVKKSGG